MRSPARRAQFVAGRWLLRELLAHSHGGAAAQWRLEGGESGPPVVLCGAATPYLALAHSGEAVAAAVAHTAVGIDVEQPLARRDVEGIARLACTAGELAMLATGGLGFYEVWTAKEAWLKRHSQAVAPARLQELETSAAPPVQADVRVWTHGGWWLAVSLPPSAIVRWLGITPHLHSCLRVTDLKPTGGLAQAAHPCQSPEK